MQPDINARMAAAFHDWLDSHIEGGTVGITIVGCDDSGQAFRLEIRAATEDEASAHKREVADYKRRRCP